MTEMHKNVWLLIYAQKPSNKPEPIKQNVSLYRHGTVVKDEASDLLKA